VRLLCFSDLHCSIDAAKRLAERAVTEGVDAMASAGDLATDEMHEPELYEALAAAKRPIFSVPGNHDGDSYADYLAGGVFRDIDGRVAETGGLTIAGWGLPFLNSSLSGVDRRAQQDDPVLELVIGRLSGKDPRRTILLTHLPPWGVRVARDSSGVDMGNAQLRKWIEAFQPAAVVCGHVHLPRAKTSRVGDTIIVNPGREGYLLQL
jgi:Icc-related predicted phosphoesterase